MRLSALALLVALVAGCTGGGTAVSTPAPPAEPVLTLTGPAQTEGPAEFTATLGLDGEEIAFTYEGDGTTIAPETALTQDGRATVTATPGIPGHTGTLTARWRHLTASAVLHAMTFILDEPKGDLLNFRRCDSPFQRPGVAPRTGLDGLGISGSAQPNAPGLTAVRVQVQPRPLVVVDLRRESHGFLNGDGVSWYADRDVCNLGLPRAEVQADEEARLAAVRAAAQVTVYRVDKKVEDVITELTPRQVVPAEVLTEAQMVSGQASSSFRLPNRDHYAPEDREVDDFVAFVRALAPDDWVHYHCHGGDGRTTSFMAMHDMMRNAGQVSFEDIVLRQYLLGGIDLARLPEPPSWKRDPAAERLAFLRRFHRYCREEGPAFTQTWSDWSRQPGNS